MEQTLKITNVLSDPTRYSIYQHINKKHDDVTVMEIAELFHIHPNVARLHLTKLEDIQLLVSETQKTGKGGRPSRLYRLSDEVVQLHFPYRDYQLLARIALQSMMKLGEAGKQALYETGRAFGEELASQQLAASISSGTDISFEEKVNVLKSAAAVAGFYPEFQVNEEQTEIQFEIYNCPFKEVAAARGGDVCSMHFSFLEGMFSTLFESVRLIEKQNMMDGCKSCNYQALVN
ncbi:MAG: helix-turn-helix transcriptional regulator [Bacillus sp. (in: firmicutes)]